MDNLPSSIFHSICSTLCRPSAYKHEHKPEHVPTVSTQLHYENNLLGTIWGSIDVQLTLQYVWPGLTEAKGYRKVLSPLKPQGVFQSSWLVYLNKHRKSYSVCVAKHYSTEPVNIPIQVSCESSIGESYESYTDPRHSWVNDQNCEYEWPQATRKQREPVIHEFFEHRFK